MIRHLAIVGAGLVGGSIAAAARAAGIDRVTLTDVDPSVRARARERGLAHEVLDDLPSTVAGADVVIAAVPTAVVADVLVAAAAAAPAHAILTDAASLKAKLSLDVESRLRDLGRDGSRFVGGHPMAGSERSGPEAADARLFQGATWVLTPTAATADHVLPVLSSLLRSLGARVVALPPDRHDELVAVVSHLPQVAASALADVAADVVETTGDALLAVAGGGFRDTTRIAASDPELWLGILQGNRGAVLEALTAYTRRLESLRAAIETDDWASVMAVLTRASAARRRLVPKEAADAVVDVVVPLLDRPGQLATATTALGEAGVNVEDLAMRHATEGRRGALLVRVAAGAGAQAVEVLRAAGLRAHLESNGDRDPAVASPRLGREPRPVVPLSAPPDVSLAVPGSKSLTNRALIAAALAEGTSRLDGVLFADDTEAMLVGLQALGFELAIDRRSRSVEVVGSGGQVPFDRAALDVRLSGTTARFLAPLLALGHGSYVLDGGAPFRLRPMAPVFAALRHLGVHVDDLGVPGHVPVRIHADGLAGGRVPVAGDVSSQFLSGLLLAGPATGRGLEIALSTPLVSEHYVAMTAATMEAFGAEVARPDADTFVVAPTGYRATRYAIEPDASAASYLLAAAAITGGRVRIPGLTPEAIQGDAAFAAVLGAMGAEVVVDDRGTEVRGTGVLHGIEVDLGAMSDTAQTLAAVAVFADSPTRVTGIGFIRAKETDRIAAVVTELRRCGIDAREEPDGFLIHPGRPAPTTIATYDDHRMAMSFALLGLVVPGIAIADPDCVAKTFPSYFEVLDRLRTPGDHTGERTGD